MLKRYRKGVFIVVYRIENNSIKYLLLLRKKHWIGWEFPKGGVNRFELRKNAAKREVKEETGQIPIKLKSYPIRGNFKYSTKIRERPNIIGQTYKLYSAQIKNKNIMPDKSESSEYKWANFDTAFKMLKWPNQKFCLNYVNKYLERNK
jgi:8-oxo-dGTP pyrophosphatase MutT (NUDIX family)